MSRLFKKRLRRCSHWYGVRNFHHVLNLFEAYWHERSTRAPFTVGMGG